MSTLGERLKKLRGKTSQKQFALFLGIPSTTLANYESNKSELNFTTIELFTTKLNVATDWLIFGRGPMRPTVTESKESLSSCDSNDVISQGECRRCASLEKKLDLLEAERREISTENRQLHRENADLLREIGDLRAQVARLEERKNRLAVVSEQSVANSGVA